MTTLVVPEGAAGAGTVTGSGRLAARPEARAGGSEPRRQSERPSRRRPRGGNSSAPWVRRRHPAAPSGRPGGAPAPALCPADLPVPEGQGSSAPGASAQRAPTRGRHAAVTVSTVEIPSSVAAPIPVPARVFQSAAASPAPAARARAVPAGPGWRLTDRGVALVLMLFVVLMTASLVVVLDKALTVTSPDSGYAATR